MDERKQKVLEAIIRDYVATAEPVGSRTIARKYSLGVSPATIRNEMADLEEMGFIEQPHTSAGRIPSQRGYRYYVDCLMEKYNLHEEERAQISSSFARQIREIDSILHESGRLLSKLTNYTSIVTGPKSVQSSIQRIEFITLRPGKVLLVMLTDAGVAVNKLLDVPEAVSLQDLQLLSRSFNARLKEIMLCGIKRTLLQELRRELMQQRQLLMVVLEILDQYLQHGAEEKVYLGGILNILSQPEFRNVEKIRRLLSVLEEDDKIRDLLGEDTERGIIIRIGDENKREEFQDCSIITATYEIEGQVGRLGLLGPTRMEYSKTVTLLDFVTRALSEAMKDYFGRKK
ncbi:MAG: heat-inducible transcriptional repressor HrcA [Syntrophomonadaceae bacterium]|nr:heat-inducible transcriptional repressor HrcA [Syntrophomonadaceae bacterium]